ncbi:unnamed protein product [Peronospora belbahrii]|uniref:EamA domain-containing protein n=1 Tax=Peronospora belbahrii TaxID=622444 RepID=A0AAU9KSI6_9STRA|nr:unnamed protein product [Peronospora belbahrii]CAH0519937.1 unnamed protein product [Peronospora belbahrii]
MREAQETERLHSTVRLNQLTLQFEDPILEKKYQARLHPRKKALWLRSLLPAAASQILFALADGLDFPIEYLLLTVPTRVFVAMLQVATWVLVRWDLVRVREQTIFMVSMASGIPTLLLYTLQRPSLCQWDALFVTFGLSFYTIPKITPLSYVSSFYGSWATTALYTVLTFVVQPPRRQAEGVLGIFFLVPMVWVFNTVAYYSECNSRERFALRRRLHRESITLAVACTSPRGEAVTPDGEEDGWLLLRKLSLRGIIVTKTNSTASFVVAVILWGAFTLGSWTSLPDTLKFVDEATGWAWFSHCAGVTVFLLVMTRRLRWLLVVPVVGAFLLWVLSLAMPASWIIFSAHSMGYGLLLASVVIAMGVFGWFVCAWKELVSFLTQSCFLYPQLQAGMEREYPLLVRIVSEHTAGFDPEMLSARVPATTAINYMGTQTLEATITSLQQVELSKEAPTESSLIANQQNEKTKNIEVANTSKKQHPSTTSKRQEPTPCLKKTMIASVSASEREDMVVATDTSSGRKMVSVLPSSKPGKCFFCSKNDAEHLVPACGMWGKWAYWRMNQQHNVSTFTNKAAISKGTIAVSMCTSYYDLQNSKLQLEARIEEEEKKSSDLMEKLTTCEGLKQKLSVENVSLKAELCATKEKHAEDLRRQEAHLQEKMEAMQKETNRLAHERKVQAKTSAVTYATTLQKRLAVSELLLREANTCVQTANEEAAVLRSNLKQREEDVVEWRTKADELIKQLASMELRLQHQPHGRPSSLVGPSALDLSLVSTASGGPLVNASPVASLHTFQPVGRLPYAQSLEIEGLRESSRHAHDDVDYSKRWRLLQDSDISKSGAQ